MYSSFCDTFYRMLHCVVAFVSSEIFIEKNIQKKWKIIRKCFVHIDSWSKTLQFVRHCFKSEFVSKYIHREGVFYTRITLNVSIHVFNEK